VYKICRYEKKGSLLDYIIYKTEAFSIKKKRKNEMNGIIKIILVVLLLWWLLFPFVREGFVELCGGGR